MLKTMLLGLMASLMFSMTSFAATQPVKEIEETPKTETNEEASKESSKMESTPLEDKEEEKKSSADVEIKSEKSEAKQDKMQRNNAQFAEEMKQMQAKFEALSDDQKKEIYDLYDKINVSRVKLLEKYVEFGLITEEQANMMRNQLGEHAQNVRDGKQFLGLARLQNVKGGHPERIETDETRTDDTTETNETETEKQ